jgi:NTP pyrophosphatase (non-canonical NTP hydrolase)
MISPTNENMRDAIQIADHYGLESRMSILQEECAELIQSVSKLRRSSSTGLDTAEKREAYLVARNSVAEEMADVQILLLELSHLMCNDGMLEFQMNFKLKRTLFDIEKEEKSHARA